MQNATEHFDLRTEESFETDLDGALASLQNTGFDWDDYDGAMTEYDKSAPQNIAQHDLISILGTTFNV